MMAKLAEAMAHINDSGLAMLLYSTQGARGCES